jgi:glycosyltransferase involved in cell wall biosynthesis
MANLACSFAKRGLKVDLVLVRAKGAYLNQISSEVRIVDLKTSTPASLFPLIHYLRQERPTVLLSAMHFVNEVALLAKHLSGTSTRVVVSEHNHLSRYASSTGRRVERWTPLSAQLLYPWADQVIAVSQGVAKDLQQVTGLPPERIRVIYNPVVTPELGVKAQEPIEHPWFAPNEPPVILGVGRLVGQKDFSTLIRAFALVRRVRPVRLMILGENAGSRVTLNALIHELGLESEVEMPGFVSNPYSYLARASVFVLSSLWEGFGNVIVEALAVGTPVVSADCESGPAEILKHGEYGFLVPVRDPQAMATAILETISGRVKEVTPGWLEQFEQEKVVDQYLEALNAAYF